VTWRPKPDPKPRRGDCCAVCGKRLPLEVMLHKDPFCCTDCAKTWHGVKHT